VALPWRQVQAIFSPDMRPSLPSLERVDQIVPAPITAVHLWFDRPLTPLVDAVLIDRLSQWVFNRGRQAAGFAYQVVISASHELRGTNHADLLDQVRADLAAVWPESNQARVLSSRVITQREAVFSVRPGADEARPLQKTEIPNVLLAGDWTRTGWPATMEGAVRSGYLAVEALTAALGCPRAILAPDLPWSRLARWMIGDVQGDSDG
jgi:uncharacterized protein with NAD-binding domain and iron-sulfur cluster